MLDHTLVIAMSEFGRTPRVNGHLGRDHWPDAWSLVMAGCGVQRGVVVGNTRRQRRVRQRASPTISAICSTPGSALGHRFQGGQYDNHGQPLPIAHDECHAVKEVLA